MDAPVDTFLTVAEAHRRLPCSLPTVYNLIRAGKIPVVRFGRKMWVKETVVEALQIVGTSLLKNGDRTNGIQ